MSTLPPLYITAQAYKSFLNDERLAMDDTTNRKNKFSQMPRAHALPLTSQKI